MLNNTCAFSAIFIMNGEMSIFFPVTGYEVRKHWSLWLTFYVARFSLGCGAILLLAHCHFYGATCGCYPKVNIPSSCKWRPSLLGFCKSFGEAAHPQVNSSFLVLEV